MSGGVEAPVAITGLGALCGAGRDVGELLGALLEGRSGVAPVDGRDAARVAARVTEVRPRDLVDDRKLVKSVSRADLFGIHAAERAMAQAAWETGPRTPPRERALEERSGVFAGSDGGSYDANYDFIPGLEEARGDLAGFGRELTSAVSPMWLLRVLPNNVLCHLAIRHALRGANGCITNEGVGGSQAIAQAADALRAGRADRMVAVGHAASADAESLVRYDHAGLLAERRLAPFDRRRDGTVIGEGAAALTIETHAHARARGAEVLGEHLASSTTTEATGPLPVRPDGDGVRRAIEGALRLAGLGPGDVGLVVAHGNGTLDSDASEARAIRSVFGSRVPPVTAFKWCTGHLLAAAGALDLVLALACLRAGVVPGIATLRELDAACQGLPVATEGTEPHSAIALVLCRGFGGMNVAHLVRASPGWPDRERVG